MGILYIWVWYGTLECQPLESLFTRRISLQSATSSLPFHELRQRSSAVLIFNCKKIQQRTDNMPQDNILIRVRFQIFNADLSRTASNSRRKRKTQHYLNIVCGHSNNTRVHILLLCTGKRTAYRDERQPFSPDLFARSLRSSGKDPYTHTHTQALVTNYTHTATVNFVLFLFF